MMATKATVDRSRILQLEPLTDHFQPLAKLAVGPGILKSSTYTINNNLSVGCQNMDDQLSMVSNLHLAIWELQ